MGIEHSKVLPAGKDDPRIVDERVSRLRTSKSVVVGLRDVVEARGDHTAVRDEFTGRSLTFRELDERSDRVGAGLVDLIGPGDQRVALALDSDVDFIITAFGILKAGKTQVPLDLQNPPDRLSYILDHAEAVLIISDEVSLPRVDPLADGVRRTVDISELVFGTEAAEALPPPPSETLARIMYTSGSTGRPKGVVHSHAYLATKMAADIEFFRFGPSDRVGGLFPQAFSASTAFTFGPLLAGAAVYPYDVASHGIHPLADWINGAQITASAMVPTLLRRFIKLLPPETRFDSVRLLMTGGELVLGSDVALFQQRFPADSALVHQLAATECGPIARFVFDGSVPFNEPVVPAGFPSPGREIRILTEDGAEVPPGEVGEIVVSGGNIASGYWADPELTAQIFGVESGGRRFYRTGDAGRIDAGGRLLALGRLDARVKIRGFGVDLREVELALAGLDEVSEAVVSTVDLEAEPTLVAHLTMTSPVTVGTIRRQLGEQLPSYMVPTFFVALDEMPLTPRGKINRGALPPPDVDAVTDDERVPPDNEIEETLVKIWEQTLGVHGIGVTDDFFALGGSSVQAFEVFARIAAELGRDLPPTTLLDYPTIRTLGEAVASEEVGEVPTSLVPIRREGSKDPLFMIHGGGGYVFWAQDVAAGLDPDRPVIGLQPKPMDGRTEILRLVEEMAASYLGEIRTVQPEGPYFLAGYSFGGLVAYEMAQQLRQSGQGVAMLALLDTVPRDTEAFSGPQGIGERAEWHRAEFAKGGPTDKLGYLALLIRRRRKVIRRRYMSWRGNRYLNRVGSVPPKYRKAVFDQISGEAGRAYVRRPYSGRVTVIATRGRADDHRTAWGELAQGGLDLIEIDVSHRGMILEEDDIKLVTDLLNERLMQAEAE